jgi:hypothetical protein
MPMLMTAVIGRPGRSRAQCAGERSHPGPHLPHVQRDVAAFEEHGPVRTQRRVQGGAAFSDVHFFAGLELRDRRPKISCLRQRGQQPQRLVGDEVLRVIEQDAGVVERQLFEALRIGLEQRTHVERRAAPVLGERLPGGQTGEGGRHRQTAARKTRPILTGSARTRG